MPITSIKKIKDPIHGYVNYSRIEEGILAHPLVLRLHHIRQNGAAFLTYPSMRVHRFEHSLGAMHIAGDMFDHGIRFSTDTTVAAALPDVLGELDFDIDKIVKAIQRNSSRQGDATFVEQDSLYKLYHLNQIENKIKFAQLLMFQAVRLAALVHDIGHPPFSHTFETALKQKDPSLYRNHEVVGVELLSIILKDIDDNNLFVRGEFDLAQPAAGLAAIILDKDKLYHAKVKGLTDIVSSDIDCDRLDYVRRDAQAAGLTTNAYDLGRLYDSVKLVPYRDAAGISIHLQWTAQALSVVEAFFSVRFHLYRWALWHHAVVRQNMALVIIAASLHDLWNRKLPYLASIQPDLDDIFGLALDPSRRRDYWYFTDYFLLAKLAHIFSFLDSNRDWIGQANQADQGKKEWGIVADLHKFLLTFLHRDKRWLTPFWKRPDDYEAFASEVVGQGGERSRNFNDKLADMYRRIAHNEAKRLNHDISTLEREKNFVGEYSDYLAGVFNRTIEDEINKTAKASHCRVRAYYLTKFSPIPRDLRLKSDGGEHELKTLSPSVAALDNAWRALPHLWLFREFYEFDEGGEKTKLPAKGGDRDHLIRVKKIAADTLKRMLAE